MKTSLDFNSLYSYIDRQVGFFFPDDMDEQNEELKREALNIALLRTEKCFKHILLRGYNDNGIATFSHLHSDQYSQFLYFYSNSLWKLGADTRICDKLLCLNRTLHGLFISYKCELPHFFLLGHPLGTVLGNAKYEDFLVVFQNVTVNTAGTSTTPAPELGKGLFLGAGSKIIGDKKIGDRVSLGVDAVVYNREIPSDSVVMNMDGVCTVKERKKKKCFAQNYFDIEIT